MENHKNEKCKSNCNNMQSSVTLEQSRVGENWTTDKKHMQNNLDMERLTLNLVCWIVLYPTQLQKSIWVRTQLLDSE